MDEGGCLEWTDASILADMASNGLISLDAFSTKIYAKLPMFQHGRFLPVKYYSNQYIGSPSELFITPSAIIFCGGGGGNLNPMYLLIFLFIRIFNKL